MTQSFVSNDEPRQFLLNQRQFNQDQTNASHNMDEFYNQVIVQIMFVLK